MNLGPFTWKNPSELLEGLPAEIRKAIFLLYAAWLAHLVFLAFVMPGQWKQIVIVAILAFFLLRGKWWAWIFTLLYNALLILILYGPMALLSYTGGRHGTLLMTSGVLFLVCLSTYLLVLPGSIRHFKSSRPTAPPPRGDKP